MADKPAAGPGPLEDAIFVIGILLVLVVLWFYSGGPNKADLRGIFLHPPKPIDQGGAYGPTPTIGSTTINAHY